MTLMTPRRRHAVILAVAPLALGAVLAACSSGSSSGSGGSSAAGGSAAATSKEPQTIHFTYTTANANETYYQTLAKDFEAAHPGVTVKTTAIALTAADQTIPTQLQAGNGPDVFWVNAGSGQQDSIGQLGRANLLLPVNAATYANIPASEMAGWSLNGTTYGVPTSTQALGVIWNDALAKANGANVTADSSISDIAAQCPAVAKKGKSIYGLAGSIPQNTGLMTADIATSTVYGPDPNWNEDRASGKTTFEGTQGWHQALQAVIDLNKAGCFQKGAAGAGFDALTNGAGQGQLFGFFAPGGATKDIMDAAHGAVKLTALPMPAPQGVKTVLTLSSNTGLAGNKATKSPNLVQEFLAFSVSPEEAKKIANAQGSIPIGSPSTSDLLPQYQPIIPFLEAKNFLPFGPDAWPNAKVYDALGTGVTGLLTGQKSVDDVLKSMDQAWG